MPLAAEVSGPLCTQNLYGLLDLFRKQCKVRALLVTTEQNLKKYLVFRRTCHVLVRLRCFNMP